MYIASMDGTCKLHAVIICFENWAQQFSLHSAIHLILFYQDWQHTVCYSTVSFIISNEARYWLDKTIYFYRMVNSVGECYSIRLNT